MQHEHEIVLSDTSCLIGLSGIDSLELLHGLFDRIVLTEEVAREYGNVLPDWFEIRKLSKDLLIEKEKINLDEGEASAIALASSLSDCLLIIDEAKARKEAARRKLNHIGVVGILKLAKSEGLIPEIETYLRRLKANGFRLSDTLIQETLHEAGES